MSCCSSSPPSTTRIEPSPGPKAGPLLGEHVAGDAVERAEELAGLEVDVVVPFLEAVEFFQDRDRDGDVVLFEIANAAGVVQDDIRVEDEELGMVLRGASVHRGPVGEGCPCFRQAFRGYHHFFGLGEYGTFPSELHKHTKA